MTHNFDEPLEDGGKMISVTWGKFPGSVRVTKPYVMDLNEQDEQVVVYCINQGIDSHLQAVFFDDGGVVDGKRKITIKDEASLRTLVRRLMEHEDEYRTGGDLASDIMYTLGVEWV